MRQKRMERITNPNYETSDEDSESDSDDVPKECPICDEEFKDPVVTQCGHFFNEKCAIRYYQNESKNCMVCGKPTNGVFNNALQIINKKKKEYELKRKKKKDQRR